MLDRFRFDVGASSQNGTSWYLLVLLLNAKHTSVMQLVPVADLSRVVGSSIP